MMTEQSMMMGLGLGMAMILQVATAAEAVKPAAGGFGAPEDITFKALFDGSPQKYVQLTPATGVSPTKPVDVLLAFHGHGSDRWQYINDGRGECKGARDFAAAHGMIYISPDYRAATSWMGPAAEADVKQIIGLLRKKHKVGRVFLTGASMGGTSVLIFAALHPDLVDGVTSLNGMANMEEYKGFLPAIAASYGGDKKTKPEEYKKRSAELFPEKFTMPVAFAVGGKDGIVPPDSVRRLAAKLKDMKRDVLMIDNLNGGHATSHADTTAALEFMLKTATAKPKKKTAF